MLCDVMRVCRAASENVIVGAFVFPPWCLCSLLSLFYCRMRPINTETWLLHTVDYANDNKAAVDISFSQDELCFNVHSYWRRSLQAYRCNLNKTKKNGLKYWWAALFPSVASKSDQWFDEQREREQPGGLKPVSPLVDVWNEKVNARQRLHQRKYTSAALILACNWILASWLA